MTQISYLTEKHPVMDRMFTARAEQFVSRRGWNLRVDSRGFEFDQFDNPDSAPIYVVCHDADWQHMGSLRALPGNGENLAREIRRKSFRRTDFLRSVDASRLVVEPGADSKTILKLVSGFMALGLVSGRARALVIYDDFMLRIYRRLGLRLTERGEDCGVIDFNFSEYRRYCQRALLPEEETLVNAEKGAQIWLS